jgi:hypothetical protein
MALGSELPRLSGYPFDVRYSAGALARARVMADITAAAYSYFSARFSGVEPDISVVVADEGDWPDDGPSFGMPFFSEVRGERPGVLVMPVGAGDFWDSMARGLLDGAVADETRLATVYSNSSGGVDFQPFVDLLTLHELAHSFEVLGELNLPTQWLGELFANLALHTFVATRRPADLDLLETFALVGVGNEALSARMRAGEYHTLDEFEAHYPGSEEPIGWLNYVWFQCRFQRLAAAMYEADGEEVLGRLWDCFHAIEHANAGIDPARSLAQIVSDEVGPTLGRAVLAWR